MKLGSVIRRRLTFWFICAALAGGALGAAFMWLLPRIPAMNRDLTALLAALLLALLGLILGALNASAITQPLSEMRTAMNALSRGSVRALAVSYRSKDECGALAQSMRTAARELYTRLAALGAPEAAPLPVSDKGDKGDDFAKAQTRISQRIGRLEDTLAQLGRTAAQISESAALAVRSARAVSLSSAGPAGEATRLNIALSALSPGIQGLAASARRLEKSAAQAADTAGPVQSTLYRTSETLCAPEAQERLNVCLNALRYLSRQGEALAVSAALMVPGSSGPVTKELAALARSVAKAAENVRAMLEDMSCSMENARQSCRGAAGVLQKAQSAMLETRRGAEALRKEADACCPQIMRTARLARELARTAGAQREAAKKGAADAAGLSSAALEIRLLGSRIPCPGNTARAVAAPPETAARGRDVSSPGNGPAPKTRPLEDKTAQCKFIPGTHIHYIEEP